MSFMDIFSPSTVTKTVDAVIDTGDALFYTDEEKAQANQKIMDWKLNLLEKFAPFKLAQRYLAFAFTLNFIVAFWIGGLIRYFKGKEALNEYLSLVDTFNLGWIMLAIVGFYFTGGTLESASGLLSKGKTK